MRFLGDSSPLAQNDVLDFSCHSEGACDRRILIIFRFVLRTVKLFTFFYHVHSFLLLQLGTFLYRQESTAKKLPTCASFANQL